MQKGFGLIGILIVVGIIAILGVGALKIDYFSRNPFVPTNEEKSAIDMAEHMKDALEGKSTETTQFLGTVEDETADWKTYRNEEYGFEFKYPVDWITKESSVNPETKIIQLLAPETPSYKFDIFLTIYPKQVSLEDFLKNEFDSNLDWKDVNFSNVPAREVVTTDKFGHVQIFTLFVKDNFGYEFASSPYTKGEETIPLVRQIGTTFKFVQQ